MFSTYCRGIQLAATSTWKASERVWIVTLTRDDPTKKLVVVVLPETVTGTPNAEQVLYDALLEGLDTWIVRSEDFEGAFDPATQPKTPEIPLLPVEEFLGGEAGAFFGAVRFKDLDA